jgi:hypothetical protein
MHGAGQEPAAAKLLDQALQSSKGGEFDNN